MTPEELEIQKEKIKNYEDKHLNGYWRIYPHEADKEEENYVAYMAQAKQIQDEFTGTKKVSRI